MKIIIRRARSSDINEIYSIGKRTIELNFSKKMNFHDKIELREFIKRPRDNLLIIAEIDNDTIGFLYAKIVSRTWCILDNLVVKPEFRKLGTGHLLLEELYKILKNNKITYIQILEDINNKKTRKFWKDNGFKEEKVFIWADKRI